MSLILLPLSSLSILLLLYIPSPATSEGKIPYPDPLGYLDRRYCSPTNDSANIIGPCEPGQSNAGTKSVCPPYCMKKVGISYGEACDPFLYRFARRKYDDADENKKDWRRYILGNNFNQEDSDFHYQGECAFFCPAVLCMNVEYDPQGYQFVDMTLFDCVSTHTINKYLGVCTCGHQWSWVDPANSHRRYDSETRLVAYKRTVGLSRALAWDKKNGRCAASRYGHCSLNWDATAFQDKITYCLDDRHTCVNRTASHLGRSFRPLLTKETGQWYGICDSHILITDPFTGGKEAGKVVSSWLLSGLVLVVLRGQLDN